MNPANPDGGSLRDKGEYLAALPKPFGFTEYGPHGSQDPPGDYDYHRFIEGIEKHFPKTCFFMSWNAMWSLATNQNVKGLLEHPSVANRKGLPQWVLVNPSTLSVNKP